MKTIRDVVRDMLDGRQNDEQITVEVSLLWSLLDAPPDEERLARAMHTVHGGGPCFTRYRNCEHNAAAIAKAYREDTDHATD